VVRQTDHAMSNKRKQTSTGFDYLTLPPLGGDDPQGGFVEYLPVDDFFDKVRCSPASIACPRRPRPPPNNCDPTSAPIDLMAPVPEGQSALACHRAWRQQARRDRPC